MNYPFVGIPTFLRSPFVPDVATLEADIAVLGVPPDEGSPFMPGSRFGPRGIREHSLRFTSDTPGYYNPQTRRVYLEREMRDARIADVGDAQVLPTNIERTFDNITNAVAKILGRGAMPVVLGGDHAITYPVVRAFEGPLHVVHFDAHLDYMPFVHGLSMTNQHAFRHIAHMKHVQSLTQVGIRSIRNTAKMMVDTESDGNRVVTMAAFRSLQGKDLFGHIPRNAPCYVSIDIDVLDLPLVPGCVSAEPDGMSYAELKATLATIAESFQVVGFDLVEVNPQLDVGTGVTSYLAAHTVIEFLGEICDQPSWRSRQSA